MARLYVDYQAVRNDPRFRALGRKLGGEGNAWEMVLRFWSIAQKFWGKEQLVPRKLFDLEGDLEPLLEVDLAVARGEEIYARGSEEAFAWYLAKCQASRKAMEGRRSTTRSTTRSPSDAPLGPPIGQPIGLPAVDHLCSPSSSLTEKTEGKSLFADPPLNRPYMAIHEAWQAHHGNLQGVQKLTDPRRAQMRVRWNEEPDPAYWVAVVKKMAASSFCLSGKWATFDWLIANGKNHVKAAEGSYDDPGAVSATPGAIVVQKPDALARRIRRVDANSPESDFD